MAEKGPWLFAAALDLLVENVRDDEVVNRLLNLAEGSRDSLRGAYARALALAGELPGDVVAKRAVEVLTQAMRGAVAPLRSGARRPT